MDSKDRLVLKWFTSLSLIQVKYLTEKHFGNLPIESLNGELVTEMYKKKMEIKPVMIVEGQEVLCVKTINISGVDYFIEGKKYLSPSTNCFINEQGVTNFVPRVNLFNFDL